MPVVARRAARVLPAGAGLVGGAPSLPPRRDSLYQALRLLLLLVVVLQASGTGRAHAPSEATAVHGCAPAAPHLRQLLHSIVVVALAKGHAGAAVGHWADARFVRRRVGQRGAQRRWSVGRGGETRRGGASGEVQCRRLGSGQQWSWAADEQATRAGTTPVGRRQAAERRRRPAPTTGPALTQAASRPRPQVPPGAPGRLAALLGRSALAVPPAPRQHTEQPVQPPHRSRPHARIARRGPGAAAAPPTACAGFFWLVEGSSRGKGGRSSCDQ